jgi:hypothetical protein
MMPKPRALTLFVRMYPTSKRKEAANRGGLRSDILE